MSGSLKEFLNSLKPKEKIMIILSMAALGIVLIGAVLLIAFCSKPDHVHKYEYRPEKVGDSFNLYANCVAEGCDNPEIYLENIEVTEESRKAPTCLAEGEIVYVYNHEQDVVRFAVYTDKIGHVSQGVEIDIEQTVDAAKVPGIITDVQCGKSGSGSFVCDNCAKEFTVSVKKPAHKFIVDYENAVIPTRTENGSITFWCENNGCPIEDTVTLPKLVYGQNAFPILDENGNSTGYVTYKTKVFFGVVEVVFDKIEFR